MVTVGIMTTFEGTNGYDPTHPKVRFVLLEAHLN